MHPKLFTIRFPFDVPIIGESLTIHTYGVFLALGFLVGTVYVLLKAKKVGEDQNKIMDLNFWLLIASIVGAKLLFLIVKFDKVIKEWEKGKGFEFIFARGGFVFFGGVLGAVIVGIYYQKKKGVNTLKWADMYMPAVALGVAIGRFACLSAGCCFGKYAPNLPLAIRFTNPETMTYPPKGLLETKYPQLLGTRRAMDTDLVLGEPLHPTQIYMSLNSLLIFIILILVWRKKKFDGQIFLLYLILYSIGRSIIEIFRGDYLRGFVIEGHLSTSQFISIPIVIVSLYFYFKLKKKALENEKKKKKKGKGKNKKKRNK